MKEDARSLRKCLHHGYLRNVADHGIRNRNPELVSRRPRRPRRVDDEHVEVPYLGSESACTDTGSGLTLRSKGHRPAHIDPAISQLLAKQYSRPAPPVATKFSWLHPREGCVEFHEIPPPFLWTIHLHAEPDVRRGRSQYRIAAAISDGWRAIAGIQLSVVVLTGTRFHKYSLVFRGSRCLRSFAGRRTTPM